MPKLPHEAVVEILQNEPELILSLLAYSGIRLRFGVFAITEDAARGSAKPIRTGHPGWDLVPLISGIGKIPGLPVKDARFGAELTLLRIITGELTLGTHDARMFALTAIRSAPAERITRYARYLKALAPPAVRNSLETLMKLELKDAFIDGWIEEGLQKGLAEGLERGLAEGLEKGRAEGLKEGLDVGLEEGRLGNAQQMTLRLLEKRFSVAEGVRKHVEECTDVVKIDAWFDRAVTAKSLDEVFAE